MTEFIIENRTEFFLHPLMSEWYESATLHVCGVTCKS